MPQYRLYLLDKNGGYEKSIDLDCVGDAQAEMAAAKHHKGVPMVLWGKNRVIAEIEVPSPPPQLINNPTGP